MLKKIFLLVLFLIPFISISQSLEEAANQAASMGIVNQVDILNELDKRGMTEDDARRMAQIYGISYDEYLSRYVLKAETSSSSNIGSSGLDLTNISTSDAMIRSSGDREIFGTPTTMTIDTMYDAPSNYGSEPFSIMNNYAEETFGYFGYDIFLNNPFADKEYLVGNIDEGYILAPGDVLRLYVFGDNSFQAEVVIDLNGNIYLPGVGMFFASGYTFKSLKSRLTGFLGKSFSGLVDNPQRSFIDISLTQIRPVKVTVLGETNTPGPHLVSGFATVLNSLYPSGGVKKSGSLRNIQVFRNNKLKKTIDLYDYVTKWLKNII